MLEDSGLEERVVAVAVAGLVVGQDLECQLNARQLECGWVQIVLYYLDALLFVLVETYYVDGTSARPFSPSIVDKRHNLSYSHS